MTRYRAMLSGVHIERRIDRLQRMSPEALAILSGSLVHHSSHPSGGVHDQEVFAALGESVSNKYQLDAAFRALTLLFRLESERKNRRLRENLGRLLDMCRRVPA